MGLIALSLALVLIQLSRAYPSEALYYLFFALVTAILFLFSGRDRGARGIFLSAVLFFGWIGAETPDSEPAPECGAVSGKILRTKRNSRTGEKQLYLQNSGGLVSISVPDLPWGEYAELLEGAVGAFTLKRCRDLGDLESLPPWDFNWYLKRDGVQRTASATSVSVVSKSTQTPSASDKILEQVFQTIPDSEGLSIILASDLGRGELLSRNVDTVFKETSTTHLLVVSGFHISVVAKLLGNISEFGLRFRPKIYLVVPLPILRCLCALIGGLLYSSLVGFSLTVFRALVALLIYSLSLTVRGTGGSAGTAYAFLVTQIIWPLSIFEPGCQLTFAALVGLTLASVMSQRVFGDKQEGILSLSELRKERLVRHLGRPLVESFTVCLTTSMVTLLWFSQIVPAGPLINLFAIPVFTWVVVFLGGASLIVFSLLGIALPLELAALLTENFYYILKWVAEGLKDTLLGPVRLEGSSLVAAEILLGMILVGIAVSRRGRGEARNSREIVALER